MTLRIDIPDGLAIPPDWNGRKSVPLEEFRAWLAGKYNPKKFKRSKYNAKQGIRDDLGFATRSSLEANFARLLLFRGFKRFTDKFPAEPPSSGKWFRYEGRRFEFAYKYRGREKYLYYLVDFEVFEDGQYTIYECKGKMDAASERKLAYMVKEHPNINVILVRAKDLNEMAKTAKGLIKEWE